MIRQAAAATTPCARVATPTAAPCAVSPVGCSGSPASCCNDGSCSTPITARQRQPEFKPYPSVRLKLTSFRPDLPVGRAPRASAVQEAAQRPRRSAPARSVLDGASTALGSSGREGSVPPPDILAPGRHQALDGG